VIETLLPDAATVVEAFDDPPGVALFPQERERVRQAVDKRVREFTTVRHCARTALDRLGIPPAPILPDAHGAPQWPEGIVGSMTHCDGYRAAAVARATQIATLGVDAEPHGPLPDDVIGTVSLPEERKRIALLTARRPEVHWDRLLFSAKESVYKAWYPLTGAWLDFEEALITFALEGDVEADAGAKADVDADAAPERFYARLLVPGPIVGGMRLTGFSGRWKVQDGLLFTAIAVPAPPAVR
jgi:enterobactin synthetase component D / holo-[acyl-carrier protein] synthase